jgi:hypothetical protein
VGGTVSVRLHSAKVRDRDPTSSKESFRFGLEDQDTTMVPDAILCWESISNHERCELPHFL